MSMLRHGRFVTCVVLCGALVGCETREETPDSEPVESIEPTQTGGPAQPPPPDTSAAAVWSYLQAANYADGWEHWPGKTQLYTGIEPHGMLLSTYYNEMAGPSITSGDIATLPDRSIIVKENYMPDSTLAAVTVMYKVQGYNPEHGDWWWAKYDAAGVVETSGRAEMCIACHSGSSGDYLLTPIQAGGN